MWGEGGGGAGVLKHGVGDEAVHGGSTARLPALAPDPEKRALTGRGRQGGNGKAGGRAALLRRPRLEERLCPAGRKGEGM